MNPLKSDAAAQRFRGEIPLHGMILRVPTIMGSNNVDRIFAPRLIALRDAGMPILPRVYDTDRRTVVELFQNAPAEATWSLVAILAGIAAGARNSVALEKWAARDPIEAVIHAADIEPGITMWLGQVIPPETICTTADPLVRKQGYRRIARHLHRSGKRFSHTYAPTGRARPLTGIPAPHAMLAMALDSEASHHPRCTCQRPRNASTGFREQVLPVLLAAHAGVNAVLLEQMIHANRGA